MLVPWKKSYDQSRQLLKSRDNTLPTKVCLVKAMVFPVVMYGCESWAIKKAEHRRIDAFELWCWRLLRVPWTARRSNHSILKEINPDIHWKDWCWRWNSSTLATRCEELTHWKRPWCWEQLKAGGEGDDKGWDGWMASPTWWMWDWANSGSYWWTAKARVLRSMGSQRVGHDWATELNTNVKYTCVCVCTYVCAHTYMCVYLCAHTMEYYSAMKRMKSCHLQQQGCT